MENTGWKYSPRRRAAASDGDALRPHELVGDDLFPVGPAAYSGPDSPLSFDVKSGGMAVSTFEIPRDEAPSISRPEKGWGLRSMMLRARRTLASVSCGICIGH